MRSIVAFEVLLMKKGTKLVEYDPILLAEAFILWYSTPHGDKAFIVKKYADFFRISQQHMYRLLKEFNNFRPYIEMKYGK